MNHWLMKTEPTTFSIDHLAKQKVSHWEGVRNYAARNFMRDGMKAGDEILIYHSNCLPPGIAGLARVHREAYADHFAMDPKSKYFDPKASKEKPIWMMVDVEFVKKLPRFIPLDELKKRPELAGMEVLRTGSRLSVQPVSEAHFKLILGFV